MILLSSPLKNDPLETTVSIFFLEIEIFTTKIVNSKSLKKICRQLLSTMNVLTVILLLSLLLKNIDQLRLFCETHKPHVLCLNETKLDNEIRDEDLVIEGFHSIYRKDRDRHGGGVAMFISEEIKFLKQEDLETDFESLLTVELNIQYVKPILITTIYRPPDSLVDLFDKADDLLRKIEFENRESIIAGDMNCNLLIRKKIILSTSKMLIVHLAILSW